MHISSPSGLSKSLFLGFAISLSDWDFSARAQDLMPPKEAVTAREIKELIEALDSPEYYDRLEAQERVAADAKRLIPPLAEATSLARASLEVRVAVLRIAAYNGLSIERPERNCVESVEWAVKNVATSSGSVRHAVSEVLHENPLMHVKPELTQALSDDLLGRQFIAGLNSFAVKRPMEFIFAVEDLGTDNTAALFHTSAGKEVMQRGIKNALRKNFANSHLTEAVQLKLLGSSHATIEALVQEQFDAAAETNNLQDVIKLVSRAVRLFDCTGRLNSLGVDYNRAGLPLLEAAANTDPEAHKVLEKILGGVERHYHDILKKNEGAKDPAPEIGSFYEDAGGLWRLAFIQDRFKTWLEPLHIDLEGLLGRALSNAQELSTQEFLRCCWESQVLIGIAPDGQKPSQEWPLKIIPLLHEGLSKNPPESYDKWKTEHIENWIAVVRSLNTHSLPAELFPQALIADSLPPRHIGGHGTAWGALENYAKLIDLTYEQAEPCAQSKEIIAETLVHLTALESAWHEERLQAILELIYSIENTNRDLRSRSAAPTEIEMHLNKMHENGMKEILNPKPEPPSQPAVPQVQGDGEKTKHPTIESLERALEIMERAIQGSGQ